jgi:hypothetical protein
MLTNSQVFYYHHNTKTCLLQLVQFNYSHLSQIGQEVKDMFWRCACGMPHHDVVRLVIILVAKVKVFLSHLCHFLVIFPIVIE